ncbi:MAG: permease-like cell division protein FtsX [Bacteroidales bacterium]|nr:permease-like cell division protein FtsX [Bacteroidales bacterium]MBP5518242.1 permease-like cell division protein FtsX [Bacteroidales bacterium]
MDRKEKGILRRRFWRSYISSVISISLVLFIVGLFALLFFSVRRISAYFKENVKISVILSEKVSPAQAEQFSVNLAKMPQVLSAELKTQEQGTQEMKELLGEDFLEEFETNFLPACVELQLNEAYFEADSIAALKNLLCEDPMVDGVEYQEDIISSINRNLRRMSIAFVFFIALLAVISIVLISNTVRLNIFSKRFAVRTMQLVGATRGFIQRPFLLNSVLQGALGGAIAAGGLYAAQAAARKQIPQLNSIIGTETFLYCAAGLLALGVLLCLACTFLTVRKMTAMSVDRLYF